MEGIISGWTVKVLGVALIILALLIMLSNFAFFYQYTGIEGFLNASLKMRIISIVVGIVGIIVGYVCIKKS